MFYRTWLATMSVILLVLLGATTAPAAKVLVIRTEGWRSSGARPDITVPYLTTGKTAFMPGPYVAPRIYQSDMLDTPYLPDMQPVYNLPFWGGIQAFGTRSNGAMPTGLAVTPRELSPAVRRNAAMPVGTTLHSKGN